MNPSFFYCQPKLFAPTGRNGLPDHTPKFECQQTSGPKRFLFIHCSQQFTKRGGGELQIIKIFFYGVEVIFSYLKTSIFRILCLYNCFLYFNSLLAYMKESLLCWYLHPAFSSSSPIVEGPSVTSLGLGTPPMEISVFHVYHPMFSTYHLPTPKPGHTTPSVQFIKTLNKHTSHPTLISILYDFSHLFSPYMLLASF